MTNYYFHTASMSNVTAMSCVDLETQGISGGDFVVNGTTHVSCNTSSEAIFNILSLLMRYLFYC